MNKTQAIILAAGKGTRLKSSLPKVLHQIANKPMIHHVIDACKSANISDICLVVGYKKELIIESCSNYDTSYSIQEEQLGTGHAVICALDNIKSSNSKQIIVLAGDCPLIQPETLSELIHHHESTNAAATLLTGVLPDAGNYGRIIRTESNTIYAIQEAKDCSKEELKITEFNSGIYCFNKDKLIESIQKLQTNNAQNEYYLTDIINILYEEKHIISGHCISTVYEVLGANTQEELQTLNEQAIKLAH